MPEDALASGVDPDVRAAFDESLNVLRALGASVQPIALPTSRVGISVYYLVAMAEASSNLARYDGVRYGLRAADAADARRAVRSHAARGLRRRGQAPHHARHVCPVAGYYDAYYLKAQQVRTLIRRDFDTAFADVDVVAMPTSPTPAFKLGERTNDPLQMYLADIFTVTAPLAGLPAISVPCGFSSAQLPIGLQLIGRAWDEGTLFEIAGAYEGATPWAARHPAVSTTPRRGAASA